MSSYGTYLPNNKQTTNKREKRKKRSGFSLTCGVSLCCVVEKGTILRGVDDGTGTTKGDYGLGGGGSEGFGLDRRSRTHDRGNSSVLFVRLLNLNFSLRDEVCGCVFCVPEIDVM